MERDGGGGRLVEDKRITTATVALVAQRCRQSGCTEEPEAEEVKSLQDILENGIDHTSEYMVLNCLQDLHINAVRSEDNTVRLHDLIEESEYMAKWFKTFAAQLRHIQKTGEIPDLP
jgi:hypothetical protein